MLIYRASGEGRRYGTGRSLVTSNSNWHHLPPFQLERASADKRLQSNRIQRRKARSATASIFLSQRFGVEVRGLRHPLMSGKRK